MLCIEYDETLVPAEGAEVVAGTCAFGKTFNKDAAGAAFHHLCLLQAGLIGAQPAVRHPPYTYI